jgi:Plavaka transposase
VRRCYPIMCGIMADYEEQVLLTGVKSRQHCTMCQVPPLKRENLTEKQYPPRTHEETRRQIKRQQLENILPSSDDWVHPVECFAWHHRLFNIHKGMMVDVLHQLLKGIVMRLIEWVRKLVGDVVQLKRKRRGTKTTTTNMSAEAQLDQRFRQVPAFTGLKRFDNLSFSKVTQWTGDEQKAMVRQLVAVLAPLLSSREPYAMHFTRAVCDFVIMAQYRTHDEETLRYMHHALYRIDMLKGVFQSFRPKAKDSDTGHFNIPKFHALVHFEENIRLYGCADGYCTGANGEAGHRYIVKAFYDLTNKRDSLSQICSHNSRRVAVLAMEDEIAFTNSDSVPQSSRRLEVQVTQPTQHLAVAKLQWPLEDMDGATDLVQRRLGLKTWLHISHVANCCEIPGFLDGIAVFVRECRRKLQGELAQNSDMDQKEKDPSWVKRLLVKIHPSIRCWKRDGKNATDLEGQISEVVRCTPNWQCSNQWRRDHVWVQEYMDNGDRIGKGRTPLGGRLVGQLQLIVTVLDIERLDKYGVYVQYTGAMVELLQPLNHGLPHPTHGMVEVKRWPRSSVNTRQVLGGGRFYSMPSILRSAHVVPAATSCPDLYYVNNYIDWDQYNTLYSDNFLEEGTRIALSYRSQDK